jgi:hypothetical protein
MIFDDFQREYARDLVGELIYARVRLLADRLLRRRDPLVYARGAHNHRDALGDVVNDFVVDVLIGERQVDYVMATARHLDDFDRLVRRQLRRYLARTRMRTVVDNLIDRSVSAMRSPPFAAAGSGELERFALADEPGDPDTSVMEAQLRRAAALAQAVPKIPSEATERAPKIYDGEGLRRVLTVLCRAVTSPLSRQDLQTFFEDLLTAWAPSFLEPGEEQDSPAVDLTPSEQSVVNETAHELVATMTDEDRLIFQYKFANLPDREVAEALGLSRQSTAPRKQALFARLIEELADYERQLQTAVLARINLLIDLAGEDVG